MKKIILSISVLSMVIIITGCSQKAAIVNTDAKQEIASPCLKLCTKIEGICPNFLSAERCQTECKNWDQESMEKIDQASNCQELFVIPEIVSASVPEINSPALTESKSECEAACNNYVNQCLTLVPNASQALFQEGLSSCLEKCTGWQEAMIKCIKQAADCPSMTDICGL